MRAHGGSKRRLVGKSGPQQLARRKKLNTTPADGIVILRLLHRLLKYSQSRQFYHLGYLFYFSPLEILRNGCFVVASMRRRATFYALSAFYTGLTFSRFLVLIEYLSREGLDETGTLCALYWIAMFGMSCLFYGVWIHEDMRQLLNRSHPQCMRQVCGLEDGAFSSLSFCLIRMMAFYLVFTCTLLSSLFCLYSDSLPVCVYPTVKGILPDWEIPRILWQMALYPVEVLSVVPPAVPAFISLYVILMGQTHLKDQLKSLRKLTISNFGTWKKVEREYRSALVYNQIFMVWMKQMTTSAVVCSELGLIATVYATLTSFERLPFYIYGALPVGAVALMGTFTFACMEAVVSTTIAQDVTASLRERSGFYGSLCPDERREFLLRGRCLRPIVFPIGNFTKMSMSVPVYVFEEVLTQILFLLSL